MSFNISCPTCGDRQVEEFQYGSEQEPRPSHESSDTEWNLYLYSKNNVYGKESEWWYHQYGCKRWILLTRDTISNQVQSSVDPYMEIN